MSILIAKFTGEQYTTVDIIQWQDDSTQRSLSTAYKTKTLGLKRPAIELFINSCILIIKRNFIKRRSAGKDFLGILL